VVLPTITLRPVEVMTGSHDQDGRLVFACSRTGNLWQCWSSWMMRSTGTSVAVGFLRWASAHAVDQASRSLGASKKLRRGLKNRFVSIGYVSHSIQHTNALNRLLEGMKFLEGMLNRRFKAIALARGSNIDYLSGDGSLVPARRNLAH
jgi:hypothetical protein